MTNTLPELRMIVGTQRSGTTALLSSLTENPKVGGIYQPVLSGYRYSADKKPDYKIYADAFEDLHPVMKKTPKDFYVAKETIGSANPNVPKKELMVEIFPDNKAIQKTKPLFIFRDPFQTWASWKKQKKSLNVLVTSYKRVFELFEKAKQVTKDVRVLSYKHLMDNPHAVLAQLCKHWGIPFENTMVDWKRGYSSQAINITQASIKRIEKRGTLGLKAVEKSKKLGETKVYDLSTLTAEEKALIEKELMPIFKKVQALSGKYFPVVKEKVMKAVKTVA